MPVLPLDINILVGFTEQLPLTVRFGSGSIVLPGCSLIIALLKLMGILNTSLSLKYSLNILVILYSVKPGLLLT